MGAVLLLKRHPLRPLQHHQVIGWTGYVALFARGASLRHSRMATRSHAVAAPSTASKRDAGASILQAVVTHGLRPHPAERVSAHLQSTLHAAPAKIACAVSARSAQRNARLTHDCSLQDAAQAPGRALGTQQNRLTAHGTMAKRHCQSQLSAHVGHSAARALPLAATSVQRPRRTVGAWPVARPGPPGVRDRVQA